jgi:hypothetical protein
MNNSNSREVNSDPIRQDILDDIALRDKIGEKYLDVAIKSIEQMRRWVFEVITISSAIMGVFVVIGSDKPFIKNSQLLPFSLLLLLAVIVYGIAHLKRSIEKDINELPKQAERLRNMQNEVIKAKTTFYNEKSQDNADKLHQIIKKSVKELDGKSKQTPKKDYSGDIIVLLFSAALILISFSMLDFNFMRINLNFIININGGQINMSNLSILSVLFTLLGSYYLVRGNLKSIMDIVHESSTYWGANYALRKSMITQKANSIVGFLLLSAGIIAQIFSLSLPLPSSFFINAWIAIIIIILLTVVLSELFIVVFNKKQIIASSIMLLKEYADGESSLFESMKKYCSNQEKAIISLMENYFFFKHGSQEDYSAYLQRVKMYFETIN